MEQLQLQTRVKIIVTSLCAWRATMPVVQLPEDVRALEECPFPVEWQPVVTMLQFQTPQIDGLSLRDTLLRKEKIRVVQVL